MNASAQAQQRILRTAVAFVFAAALAACQSPNERPNAAKGQAVPSQEVPDSPQKTYYETAPETDVDMNQPADHEASAETSSMQADDNDSTVSEEGLASGKWNIDAPKLNGISLRDSRSDMMKQHGTPTDSYSLLDPSGEIEVLEYEGYSVGIHQEGTVYFVEVYDPRISTGLGRLQVGHMPEIATRELGEPDEESDFLLIYAARDAALRIDIDPLKNEIVAIKLIAER